jgi:hypothetical protein
MQRCSDASLRRWYFFFNRKYFAGELPTTTQVRWQPVGAKHDAETERLADGTFVICISPALYALRAIARLRLLHKMAHIKLWETGARCGLERGPMARELLRVLALGAVKWV